MVLDTRRIPEKLGEFGSTYRLQEGQGDNQLERNEFGEGTVVSEVGLQLRVEP